MDDIPLFEETPEPVVTEKKETPTSLVMVPKAEEKRPEPNIGRKAIPLDKVVLTPDPLPEVSINLEDKVSPPIPEVQPVPPVNTRQEGIYLSPADKTGEAGSLSSNFDNVHDVRQFDIEGFYLGMSPRAVLQMAKQKGYFISKVKKTLPLFQTSYYDALCRQSGIRAPEMIRACIRQYAQKNNQDYAEEIILTKRPTKESFHFLLTSPATGNEVYQITYHNQGDNSLNFTQTNLAKKLNRKEAFFNAVFNTYGYPDDNKELIWGAKEDAYMQVSMSGSGYDAVIKLVDRQLSNEDYFAAADWKAEQAPLHHFGFAE
ncbi:MAG: hypothetical protein ACI4OR_03300 [Alphaproteobacteria bacterium]